MHVQIYGKPNGEWTKHSQPDLMDACLVLDEALVNKKKNARINEIANKEKVNVNLLLVEKCILLFNTYQMLLILKFEDSFKASC